MKNFWLIVLTLLISSCGDDQPFVGTYRGANGLTFRTIELKSDSTYDYQTEGHAADFDIQGKFEFRDDTIILVADTPEIYGIMEYLLIGDSCLISLNNMIDKNGILYGDDFCKGRDENWTSRRWDLTNRVIIKDE